MQTRRRNPLSAPERSAQQQVAQDGFTAAVQGAQRAANPAPAAYAPAPAAQGSGFVGRRVLDIADNADGTATVLRCLDAQTEDIDIQFEAGIRCVTAIAPKAFEGCAQLRRVILPESLKLIGEMAFNGCKGLEQVVIPGSVEKIGTLAFAKCDSLTRVRIEPGVRALGPSCFSKCTKLSRVDIPASVTAFGGGVFFGCAKSLVLCAGAETTAEKYAKFNGIACDTQRFRDDEHLRFAEEEDGTLTVLGAKKDAPVCLEIPAEICGRRIARIAPKAFFACTTLEQLSIGGGVREIGENAFFSCQKLALLSIDRGLERIGESAFAGCGALIQVTLPWGTGSVGRMAFFGCSSLSFVKMPTTTKVEDMAFEACSPALRVFGGINAGRTARNTGIE